MQRLRSFIRNAFIGGVLVILPTAILAMVFHWLYGLVADLIAPLTQLVIERTDLPRWGGDVVAVTLLFLGCFLLGSLVSTSVGHYLHHRFDQTLARLAPGYRLIKEIVNQFLGDKSNSPLAHGVVARVHLYGPANPITVTGLITSRHLDGQVTVFVPTGPNPTTGFIYHLPADHVVECPLIKVDEALRTVIACGAGSGKLYAHRGPAPQPPV